jgi:branched-chain amino acid transport system ATP-binding protein
VLLEIEGLSFSYGDMIALRDISLGVEEREVVSLVGSNGAGKTTLIRCISGLLQAKTGRISFGEMRNIMGITPSQIVNMGLIQVPEGRLLFPMMSVLENLEMGASASRARPYLTESKEWVFKLFPMLAERQRQKAKTLSGGEQQMLSIGRALMARPRLLMCDEPSTGLSPLIVKKIFATIKQVNEQGLTIFLVEQNVKLALSISNRGYILENTAIKLSDTSEKLLKNEHIHQVYLGI